MSTSDKPIPIRIPPALAAKIDEAHAEAQRLGHNISKQDLMRDAMKLGLLELALMNYDPLTLAHSSKSYHTIAPFPASIAAEEYSASQPTPAQPSVNYKAALKSPKKKKTTSG